MEQKNNSTKKPLVIIGAIVAGIILIFVARAIYVNAVIDHTYDRASREYNKAYDKAQRDLDRMMDQYGY